MKRVGLAGIAACLLATLLLTGCNAPPGGAASPPSGVSAATQNPSGQKPAAEPAQTVAVKVYFASHDAQHLTAETRKVKNDALILQHTLEALVAGPQSSSLLAVVPAGTRVKGVHILDRTAYADFSAEMVKKGFGGSSMEILTVGAIVDTLTEFPEVERVQILVEGKKVSTLFGHLDVSDPLSRSPEMIKR
jgi:germination protein M